LVHHLVGRSLADIIRRPLEIGVLAAFLFALNPRLSLIALIVAPPVVLAANRLGGSMRRGTRRIQEKVGDLAVRFQEAIDGIRIIQAFRAEAREVERFGAENDEYLRRAYRTGRVEAATSPLMEAITAVGIAGVLLAGGADVLAGGMTPGAFFTYAAMLMATYQPAKTLVSVHNDLQRAGAALDRIDGLLAERPAVADRPGARRLPGLERAIRFRGATVAFDGRTVLGPLDVEVRRGERVAVVGPSGAGKSTLLNLVPRFLDPATGAVEIDGIDLRDATTESIRSLIGLVTQETVLFHDTVEANIAYGRPGATRPEIERAARAAHAHGFIERLPRGYETLVGERGLALSGGERQRIAIARAILADPAVLLLDEATAALDSAAEREVQEALAGARAGRTTLEVAHRLSTVASADRILVLDAGRLVEEGRHGDLLRRGGLYANLWALQTARATG
jgi:subfamily B ATP-binding cassette protein MsbA